VSGTGPVLAMLRGIALVERDSGIPHYTSYCNCSVNVVGQALLAAKGDKIQCKVNCNIIFFELWDTQHNWVVSQFCYQHGETFMIFINADLCFPNVHDVT
jgi:hypothetical protein